jgi:hypothetical protein
MFAHLTSTLMDSFNEAYSLYFLHLTPSYQLMYEKPTTGL